MDVQPGHCWRCEKVLPEPSVPCGFCSVAKYCSIPCRNGDEVRHTNVECKLYRRKACGTCRSAIHVRECASCNSAWYCNKECQQQDRAAHKQLCNKLKNVIRPLSIHLAPRNSNIARITRVGDPPHYFGNTMAEDFLRLNRNELSDRDRVQECLARDFHILSAGCGDLRNTVLTAGSLPDRYQGKLHITLDDFDPFVMARNVLFLFMLVRFADTDYIASSLTTIWYSLHLSKREYDLIKTSLDELIQMSSQQLHDATRGLVSVLDEDLRYLCQVWEKWRSLECQRDKRTSINLREQRKKLFETETVNEGLEVSIARLSPEDKQSMSEWYKHALFVPSQTVRQGDLKFDNPTLTGRDGGLQKQVPAYDMKAPKDYTFMYCIRVVSFPFRVWDCLRVREHTSGSCRSAMVMYHNYVTNLLQKVKRLILQGRLLIQVSLANCLDFPNYHQTLNLPNYDRIFTSNLADYVGVTKLLQIFKPLLNASNSFAAIVTESMNWVKFVPQADIKALIGSPVFAHCMQAYLSDTGNTIDGYIPSCIKEYYDNSVAFVLYLRADIMAGGLGIQALHDVPTFETVKKYNGMQMRDFRKELNKLVPFQYRVNARDLTMLNGNDRAIEWCLPIGHA